MKRIQRAKPWVDPNDAARLAASAAEDLARREAVAAAAAEALLNVRCGSAPACCIEADIVGQPMRQGMLSPMHIDFHLHHAGHCDGSPRTLSSACITLVS